MSERRHVGSWTLPSGNSCDVYFDADGLWFKWDVAPSRAWPQGDVEYYKTVVYPAVVQEVAKLTDSSVLGVIL